MIEANRLCIMAKKAVVYLRTSSGIEIAMAAVFAAGAELMFLHASKP